MSEKEYTIDRKAACRLLKVSTRTVDRYAKSKKLSTTPRNGRIYFDKREILLFRDKRMSIDKVDMSTPDLSIDNGVDKVDNFESFGQEYVYSGVDSVYKERSKKYQKGDEIYKKLYLEIKDELREKQDRLDMANYRVGQLETQVKNSIPLLEYQKERDKKEIEITEEKQRIMSRLNYEMISKRIFLTVLLIILALQPLWLLLFYK
ncbi:MAG: helix-turn-helix domain-containing protein [Candidatus Gracilibacteria bacterium]|jgi:hypothetical protein